MRLVSLGIAAICMVSAGTVAAASPASVNELQLPLAGGLTTYTAPDHTGDALPTVFPGASLGVACAEADRTADVRVVMNVMPDEAPTGYSAVLATDQKVDRGTVHVRVPKLPDLSNHTVAVKVYVTDSKGTHTCNAGRVKIG